MERTSPVGFTLIEILLSVAMIGILAGLSLPVFQAFQLKNDLSTTTDIVVQGLRRAQMLSRASQGDSSWGVDVHTGEVTIFSGSSYATRDSDLDETFDISDSLSISGTTEFVFAQLTGEPVTSGVLSLGSVSGGTSTVTVNIKGMVEY